VIGRRILLSDRPYTVVGVLPREFALPKRDQLGAFATLPDHLDIYRPAAFTAESARTQPTTSFGSLWADWRAGRRERRPSRK
jgi:hypothetical protein